MPNLEQLKVSDSILRRLRAMLAASEEEYVRSQSKSTEFLWAHCVRAAKWAQKLALEEGVSEELCILMALFHDTGKFEVALQKQLPEQALLTEEERAATIARSLLTEEGIDESTLVALEQGLRDMYHDKPPSSHSTAVAMDADRLDKLGALGIGTFFVKGALRGAPPDEWAHQQIGVELTYAMNAERTLRTIAGKKQGVGLAKRSVLFLEQLLEELELECEKIWDGSVLIAAVRPRNCTCGGRFSTTISTEGGVKCTMLTIRNTCDHCGTENTYSLCRPMVLSENEAH